MKPKPKPCPEDAVLSAEYLRKAIACAAMLPPPGDAEVRKIAESHLRLLSAPTPEEEALRGLVEAMDLCLGLGWREDTLHQKAQGDAVNRAWDAVISCIQLPAEEDENG